MCIYKYIIYVYVYIYIKQLRRAAEVRMDEVDRQTIQLDEKEGRSQEVMVERAKPRGREESDICRMCHPQYKYVYYML